MQYIVFQTEKHTSLISKFLDFIATEKGTDCCNIPRFYKLEFLRRVFIPPAEFLKGVRNFNISELIFTKFRNYYYRLDKCKNMLYFDVYLHDYISL